jgi:hypothetical protein
MKTFGRKKKRKSRPPVYLPFQVSGHTLKKEELTIDGIEFLNAMTEQLETSCGNSKWSATVTQWNPMCTRFLPHKGRGLLPSLIRPSDRFD